MLTLLARRLGLGLLVMFVVSVLVFAATELLPGDVARAVLGQGATEEAMANIRERLGLDQPAYIRYFQWLGQLMTGNLGESLASGRQITDVIGDRFWNTLFLAAMSAVVAVPLAIILGLVAAIWAESAIDRTISIATLCFVSVPDFFIAAILVLILAVNLQWLPPIAYVDTNAGFFERVEALALPIATLTFGVLAQMTRMTRTAVLNVLSSPYIEQAVLKGASRFRIILRHALPNALSPIINVIALNLAYMVSGVVVIESVFNYPGLALQMVESVAYRDIPVVQTIGMIFCATYVGLNLLADVLAIIANPRLRHPK